MDDVSSALLLAGAPAVVLIHELGHVAAARACGLRADLVVDRRGVGTALYGKPTQAQIAVTSLAGLLVSALVALVCLKLGLYGWAAMSSCLVFFNVLPSRFSDGYRAYAAMRRRVVRRPR